MIPPKLNNSTGANTNDNGIEVDEISDEEIFNE
jgi:hypothetical protein